MSPFRLPTLRRLASTISSVGGRFRRRGSRVASERAQRRLRVDPLEQRVLLTVAPTGLSDTLVNAGISAASTVAESQYTISGQSAATDHNGDFVVTWTRYDPVVDANGDAIIDPSTGSAMTDANIYGRYLTDEVQRITLPTGVLTDNVSTQYAKMAFTFGGAEVQRLTISATYQPLTFFQTNISGDIKLTFNAASTVWHYTEGPTGDETPAEHIQTLCQELQTQLNAIIQAPSGVTVTATNARTFDITFSDPTLAGDQPQIVAEFDTLTAHTGFEPAANVTTVRQPTLIGADVNGNPTILISPTSGLSTAQAIAAAFLATSQTTPIAPVDFLNPPNPNNAPPQGPYDFQAPTLRTALPSVTVTPAPTPDDPQGLRHFDITFTDQTTTTSSLYTKYGADSGKKTFPALQITKLQDELGNDITGTLASTAVVITKMSSDEFRVNPPEPDDPVTPLPDVYNQTNPAVAMDADGDFIVTWQSVVPDSQNPGSMTDIFARRFSASAITTGTVELVQGVRPLGGQFRVNTFTANPQYNPSIGIDNNGEFVISWSNTGQSASYFNGIVAQRFDRDGNRVGNEWLVNVEDTNTHDDSYVSMSQDGHFLIAWDLGNNVEAEVYNAAGAVIRAQFAVNAGFNPTAAWDTANNYLIGWDQRADTDNVGITSIGVYAREYNVGGTVIRNTFRVNSSTANTGANATWPYFQGNNQVSLDADGDVTIVYDGYGPDVSDNTTVAGTYYTASMALAENADLVQYFPAGNGLPAFLAPNFLQSSGDIDGEIEAVLINAASQGATEGQLGRLRAILDNVASIFRGEANGIMYSQYDSNPLLSSGLLASDSIVNSQRDGHNERFLIVLDSLTTQGNFVVRVTNPNVGGYTDVTITPVSNGGALGVLDRAKTAAAINNALEGVARLGNNWPETNFDGCVQVREITQAEINVRATTPWALNYDPTTQVVFEVTFQGEVHDTGVQLQLAPDGNHLKRQPVAEVQSLTFNPSAQTITNGGGWFALQMGNQTTNDLWFNAANPGSMAGALANAIEGIAATNPALAGTNPNVTVTWNGGYNFTVTFGGQNAGINQAAIQQANPKYKPAQGATDLTYTGGIASAQQTQGASPDADAPIFEEHTAASEGTAQENASIGMQPDGDFVVAWMQTETLTDGTISNQNIYFRTFNETTDTSGPIVTDFLLPSGDRIAQNGQINEELHTISVTFDEEMSITGAADVTNPNNWSLLKDGVELVGGIKQIYFGMNEAKQLGSYLGLDIGGSNKWEAVLVLDGNGTSADPSGSPLPPALGEGHYQIIAKTSLTDKAGNPLGHTGYTVNATAFSRTFDIMTPTTGADGRVNTNPAGNQSFIPTTTSAKFQYTANTVASDANGDYAIVWASDAAGATGVFAKLYDATRTPTFGSVAGQQSVLYNEKAVLDPDTGLPWANNEIRVTTDATATDVAIARSADGDFVVTWAQQSSDTTRSWDVYARRYDATGTPQGPAFLVNSTTNDVQRHPAVAMDAGGDFTITWESLNQDGSGYGIYAQRYSPAGNNVAGTDEVQYLNFVNQPSGTFQLSWDDDNNTATADKVTAVLTYSGDASLLAPSLTTALNAIGAQVQVTALSANTIAIRFITGSGSKNVAPLVVTNLHVTGNTGATITATVGTQGASGEFIVNDTTANNQMYPSIAMDAAGTFVISWTSYGQNGDAATNGNIYAKSFPSNDTFQPTSTQSSNSTTIDPRFQPVPYIVTVDNPANHLVAADAGFAGVVQVNIDNGYDNGGGFGSGSILTGGNYVLTAAHVVWDDVTNTPLDPSRVTVGVDTTAGRRVIQASKIYVNPNYLGTTYGADGAGYTHGGDIAIIQLASTAVGAAGYDIYRGRDEIGRVGTFYGYGMTGTGFTGGNTVDQKKRTGQNRIDADGRIMGSPDSYLVMDFDNGDPANDTLGNTYGIHDLGVGINEISLAPGDSGGPMFLDGKIAGVTSWGTSGNPAFGTIGLDSRVSSYASWIDSITRNSGNEFLVNANQIQVDANGLPVLTNGAQTILVNNQSNDQKWSKVGMDAAGDFVITWTSYGHDAAAGGVAGSDGANGVYARRFDLGGTAGNPFRVNTIIAGDQQHSSVAMDADGDFTIVWESFQDRGISPAPDEASSFGIYAQRYARSSQVGVNVGLGANGAVGGEFAVNQTKDGDQRLPTVAMDDTGDYVVDWSGNGPGDAQGIFQRVYNAQSDDAGPRVAEVLNVGADGLTRLHDSTNLGTGVTSFVLDFTEDLTLTGTVNSANWQYSILNPANWSLSRDGNNVAGIITSITFGYNQGYQSGVSSVRGKYEAVVTFDDDSLTSGIQPLSKGAYTLTIKDAVQDPFGNALDGDSNGTTGGYYTFTFTVGATNGNGGAPGAPGTPSSTSADVTVNIDQRYAQDSPAIASDYIGNYVVVWVTHPSATDNDVLAQRFDRYGVPQGKAISVASYTTGLQVTPDVAMDPYGNFIVAWSGPGTGDAAGVFARRFDSAGNSLGDQFLVNQYGITAITTPAPSVQRTPTVATDANGNFVIAWESFGQDGSNYGIFARRYAASGQPLSNEFQVSTTTAFNQRNADVAMDNTGDFVVTWQSEQQDGGNYGVYAQRFNAAGVRQGGEFRVNNYTTSAQVSPEVAMDATGNFVIAYQSLGQDGSGYGVYARRYTAAGAARDASEFLVNQVTEGYQITPSVAMADNGNFIVAWALYDGSRGVFARMFNADRSDYVDPTTGLPLGEFRLNANTNGDQSTPVVAMDGDGDIAAAWVAPDFDLTGIYTRVMAVNPSTYVSADTAVDPPVSLLNSATLTLTGTGGDDVFKFVAGATPGSWIVKVNGVRQTVASNVTKIEFDGRGGYDTLNFVGTSGADVVKIWSNSASFEGTGYDVTAANVEAVNADGAGGTSDLLTFYDSADNDTFVAYPAAVIATAPDATQTTTAYRHTAANFESVTANVTGGQNHVARLYDSAGDDTFIASPSTASMTGTGYALVANGYSAVRGYASTGSDTAQLYDSAGSDTFTATPTMASMVNGSSGGFTLKAMGFDAVHGYATAGGTDTANLYDSSGDDTATASSAQTVMTGKGYYERAKYFEKINLIASTGSDKGYMDGATVGTTSSPSAKIVWFNNFDELHNKVNSKDSVVQTVDAVFKAYWL